MMMALAISMFSCNDENETPEPDPITTPSELTILGGAISGVWEKNSVVDVFASFEIPANKQLIIEEGVTVVIHPNAQDVPVEIMVYGDLICLGTADNMIEFTVPDEQKSSNAATWGGIFGSELGTFGTNNVTNPPCIVMQYVKIGYAGALTTANSYTAHTYKSEAGKAVPAINTMAQHSKVIVQHCHFHSTFSDGISQLGGDMIISNNIFENIGTIVGGEGINVKDREVVDIAYNVFYSPANSCVKLSGTNASLTPGIFAVYNNTCINGGGRRTDSYYGSFGLESNCKSSVYNNLLVNCAYGINESTGSPKNDASFIGYNWYYAHTEELAEQQEDGYHCPRNNDVIPDVNGVKGGAGEHNPLFVNYPLNTPTTTGLISSSWNFHLQAGSGALTAGAEPGVISPKVNWLTNGLTVKINGQDRTFKSPAPSKYCGAFGTN